MSAGLWSRDAYEPLMMLHRDSSIRLSLPGPFMCFLVVSWMFEPEIAAWCTTNFNQHDKKQKHTDVSYRLKFWGDVWRTLQNVVMEMGKQWEQSIRLNSKTYVLPWQRFHLASLSCRTVIQRRSEMCVSQHSPHIKYSNFLWSPFWSGIIAMIQWSPCIPPLGYKLINPRLSFLFRIKSIFDQDIFETETSCTSLDFYHYLLIRWGSNKRSVRGTLNKRETKAVTGFDL